MSDETAKWGSPTGATIACRETDSDAVQIIKQDDARQRALDALDDILVANPYRYGTSLWLKYEDDKHNKAEKIKNALTQPAPVVQGWMPIETAPEGKNVLVWYKGGVEVAWRYGARWQLDTKHIESPTHWMPLPPAPVEKE